jgi:hypothetical protein
VQLRRRCRRLPHLSTKPWVPCKSPKPSSPSGPSL